MKMTLKASLLSSTKKNDIYYGDPLLQYFGKFLPIN